MKSRFIATVGVTCALISPAFSAETSQEAAAPSPEAMIKNQAAQYAKAYNNADVSALARFFADDVALTDAEGQLTQGRSGIEELLRANFAENKEAWARGGNFLTRTFKVSQDDEVLREGWQIIGWDPVEKRIRSWVFDGEGGYGEAVWTRDGKR